MTDYLEIESRDQLERAIEASYARPVLFFKHSSTCGISDRAYSEFRRYLESPGSSAVANFLIVVQRAREASDRLAVLTGVAHESPQAILVSGGRAVWHDSHLALKRDRLLGALEELGA